MTLDTHDDDFSTTTVSAGQLRSIIERIERLEEEKAEVSEQVKEVYAEALKELAAFPKNRPITKGFLDEKLKGVLKQPDEVPNEPREVPNEPRETPRWPDETPPEPE